MLSNVEDRPVCRPSLCPPSTVFEPVSDVLHGQEIEDPFRWLEDQEAPRTREWLKEQALYARSYLDNIPGRELIRNRIRQFLAVDCHDSLHKAGNRYVFRKRLAEEQQPSIYLREGASGNDELLINPAERGAGSNTSVKPLMFSADGRLLLYEVKEGGEWIARFEVFDIDSREVLPDVLPRGSLYGFAFSPDSKGFFYVYTRGNASNSLDRVVRYHQLGSSFDNDRQVFSIDCEEKVCLRVVSSTSHVGFFVYRLSEKTIVDFYLQDISGEGPLEAVVTGYEFRFTSFLCKDRIFVLTDKDAANLKIIELRRSPNGTYSSVDVVPETDARIDECWIQGDHICLLYIRKGATEVRIFDVSGREISQIHPDEDETIRLAGLSMQGDELFLERESFTKPVALFRYSITTKTSAMWSRRTSPLNSEDFTHIRTWYTSRDNTQIPMFLLGRRDALASGNAPVIMTSYGGFGLSMTPQFSVFVAFLVERGCLFALPNIRGGSEFGAEWHEAAKRQKRQVSYDDFIKAAEWLIASGYGHPDKLGIFGGSNSGLLVGVALTQRPELFKAVVCLVPLLDMLRYHLFDFAGFWKDEFGTADNPDDFAVLRSYSPYHNIRNGTVYPATMFVSGDADQNCNPLHARKMTARLQAANASDRPVFLAYNPRRGHSPVQPLSERIEALSDRMAFLCDQLEIPV